jgi:hypothetical protein
MGFHVCVGLFRDLTKALDMINSNILLQIFDAYVIRGISHQWFVSYLKYKTIGRN